MTQTVQDEGARTVPADFAFPDAVAMLRRNARSIILITVLGTGAAWAASQQLEPRYAAVATLVLERSDLKVVEAAASVERENLDRSAVETEIDIIRSRSFIGRVVDEFGLVDNPRFNRQLARSVEDNRPFQGLFRLVSGVPAPAVEAAEVALAGETATDALSATDALPAGEAGVAEYSEQRDEAISKLLAALSISRGNTESLAINLRVSAAVPDEAAELANGIAELYVQATLGAKREATEKTIAFLQDRAEQIARELAEAEQEIATFGATHHMTTGNGVDLLGAQLVDTNAQLTRARAEAADIDSRLAEVRRVMASGTTRPAAILTSPLLAALRSDEARLERERAELSLTYAEEHPKMLNKMAELASIGGLIGDEVNRIVMELENDSRTAAARVAQLAADLAALEAQQRSRELSGIALDELKRKADVKRTRHGELLTRLGQLERQSDILSPSAHVVSEAAVPANPYFPRPKLIVAGGFAGSLTLGLLLMLVREGNDTRVRSGTALQRRTGIEYLGFVPEVPPAKLKAARGLPGYLREKPQSQVAESVRGILWRAATPTARTARRKVVLVSSVAPGDGKTSFAIAMARVAATTGRRTCLVDFDLRRTGVADALEPRAPLFWRRKDDVLSLSDFLAGEGGLEDMLREDEELPNLSIIASRQQSLRGNSIFYSERLPELFEDLSDQFDLVVVDTPPAPVVNDALELADLADVVILLARWGVTRETELLAAIDAFRARGHNTLGLVLSRSKAASHATYEPGAAASYAKYAGAYFKS